MPPALTLVILGAGAAGALGGLLFGRSGQGALKGTQEEVAARVLGMRIVGAGIAEGAGLVALTLGHVADAFPLALAPAVLAAISCLLLRPGRDEWRTLMRSAHG